jgi:hypothetical protein
MRRIPAACLALALWLVPLVGVGQAAPGHAELRDPFVRPADRPPQLPAERSAAPDLHDPFLARTDAGPHDPSIVRATPDLHDPFTARRAATDLQDPFVPAERRALSASPAPTGLRDPFVAEARPAPTVRPPVDDLGLKNPFRRSPTRATRRAAVASDVEPTSSDLKNPFVRREPPTRPRRPAVVTPLRPLRAPAAGPRPAVPIQRPRHALPR